MVGTVLSQLSDNLDCYPGNKHAHEARRAMLLVRFIVSDYGLRCSYDQEPFDALGDTLEAMHDELGIQTVKIVCGEAEGVKV
jgi:hypothetical protein